MRKWLLISTVVALIGGCADFGRSTPHRSSYVSSVSSKATKVKAVAARPSAQPSVEDSPYGNSGLLKPGRTEPVIPAEE
jgi:hypothetical protein